MQLALPSSLIQSMYLGNPGNDSLPLISHLKEKSIDLDSSSLSEIGSILWPSNTALYSPEELSPQSDPQNLDNASMSGSHQHTSVSQPPHHLQLPPQQFPAAGQNMFQQHQGILTPPLTGGGRDQKSLSVPGESPYANNSSIGLGMDQSSTRDSRAAWSDSRSIMYASSAAGLQTKQTAWASTGSDMLPALPSLSLPTSQGRAYNPLPTPATPQGDAHGPSRTTSKNYSPTQTSAAADSFYFPSQPSHNVPGGGAIVYHTTSYRTQPGSPQSSHVGGVYQSYQTSGPSLIPSPPVYDTNPVSGPINSWPGHGVHTGSTAPFGTYPASGPTDYHGHSPQANPYASYNHGSETQDEVITSSVNSSTSNATESIEGNSYGNYIKPYHYKLPLTDRPFKCDQCPQSFNRNHDLKRHKRIHLPVKPFPCPTCDKTFSRKDALKRHILVKRCGQPPSGDEPNTSTASTSPTSYRIETPASLNTHHNMSSGPHTSSPYANMHHGPGSIRGMDAAPYSHEAPHHYSYSSHIEYGHDSSPPVPNGVLHHHQEPPPRPPYLAHHQLSSHSYGSSSSGSSDDHRTQYSYPPHTGAPDALRTSQPHSHWHIGMDAPSTSPYMLNHPPNN